MAHTTQYSCRQKIVPLQCLLNTCTAVALPCLALSFRYTQPSSVCSVPVSAPKHHDTVVVVLSTMVCMWDVSLGVSRGDVDTLPCESPQEATADVVSHARSLLQAWLLQAHLWGHPAGHRAARSGDLLLALLRSATGPILAR